MGILETIQSELKALKREQKALREMLAAKKAGEVSPEWLNVSDMALRYGVSRNTIKGWLHRMAAEGYSVASVQVATNSPNRICVEQFDQAFRELFEKGGAA